MRGKDCQGKDPSRSSHPDHRSRDRSTPWRKDTDAGSDLPLNQASLQRTQQSRTSAVRSGIRFPRGRGSVQWPACVHRTGSRGQRRGRTGFPRIGGSWVLPLRCGGGWLRLNFWEEGRQAVWSERTDRVKNLENVELDFRNGIAFIGGVCEMPCYDFAVLGECERAWK